MIYYRQSVKHCAKMIHDSSPHNVVLHVHLLCMWCHSVYSVFHVMVCEIVGGQELILLDQACFWPGCSWHRHSNDTTDVWPNIWVRSAWSLHGVFQHAKTDFFGNQCTGRLGEYRSSESISRYGPRCAECLYHSTFCPKVRHWNVHGFV